MTILHWFGDTIRAQLLLVPLSAARWLFIGLFLVLMAWDEPRRELVRQFRADKPSLRAIITTGYDPHQMRGKMDLHNSEIFLPKPFQTDELLQAIKTLLEDTPSPK